MTTDIDLIALYSRIRDLRGKKDMKSDFLDVTESLGAVSTAIKDCQTISIDALQKIREETVQLVLSCISLYIGSGGSIDEIIPLLTKYVDQLENEKVPKDYGIKLFLQPTKW